MRDLLFSPIRRARLRVRSRAYAASIDLAGRGLFWPVVALAAGCVLVATVLLWGPVTRLVYAWSIPIFVVFLGGSGLMALFRTLLGAVLWHWFLVYLIVGIPTLIWAASPGLGGGAQELAFWIDMFGGGVLAAGVACGAHRVRVDEQVGWAPIVGGYVAGLIGFTVYHVAAAPPRPGDWWVAPACSAVCAGIALVVASVNARRSARAVR